MAAQHESSDELTGQRYSDRLPAVERLCRERDKAQAAQRAAYEAARPTSIELDKAEGALAVVAFEAMRAGVPATMVLKASGYEAEVYDRAGRIADGIAAYLRFTYPDVMGRGLGG